MKLKTAIDYWDFIIEKEKPWYAHGIYGDYIQFIKQPLQLWMFIPCDKDGKPLEKPKHYDEWLSYEASGEKYIAKIDWLEQCKEYQQACDRKIFTGFELHDDTMFNHTPCVIRKSNGVIVNIENRTIEDIAPLKVDLVERVAEQFKY